MVCKLRGLNQYFATFSSRTSNTKTIYSYRYITKIRVNMQLLFSQFKYVVQIT